MDFNHVMTFFSFLFGLILGSFLNVCIYRIPVNKSIIHPPSSCPQCGHHIKFYDNIPLVSYLILVGRCRQCGHPISIRYPAVEFMTGLLSAALFIRHGLGAPYFLYLLFSTLLVTLSFIDLKHKIIPDILSLPGILVGLAASFFPVSEVTWSDSLIGIIGGGGFLFLVAVIFEWLTGKEGMGGGDVKLLAMIGAWLGWQALPLVILISSLTGTVIGGGSLLLTGKGYRVRIPFGPFLSLGALIYLFYGIEIASWYLRIFS